MSLALVTLSLSGGQIGFSPNPVEITGDDRIVFSAGDSNSYQVIIPAPSVSDPANTYFETTKNVITLYDVSEDSAGLTPLAKNVNTPVGGIGYTVIVNTSDNNFITPPNSPPRIIINPH